MRFAFISDIHGNFPALEIVMADIKSEQVDQIVCLGDVASLGPQPHEVIAVLRENKIPTIMGNHETYLLNPKLTEKHHPWLRTAENWCLEQLTSEDMAFIRSLPPSLTFTIDPDTTVFCFHGSPRSNEEWIHSTATPAHLDDILEGHTANVMVGGHTHVPMARRHRDDMLLNPGSVGLPFEFPLSEPGKRALPWTEYAILDIGAGRIGITLRRLPVDIEALARITRERGLPENETWLSQWTAKAQR
jgi:putative phosphoesterase